MAESPLEGMGFSFANKMIDSVFNEHAADKSFSRQKALLQMQNQMNIDNWRMNNAYNTPERQKERLIAAGLNPDMMYGQQGVAGSFAPPSGASAPSAPQAQMGITDAAGSLLALEQAKKSGEEGIAQSIRNQYLSREIELTLDNLTEDLKVKGKQREQMTQSILESQNNIDMLRKRVGNETYDRLLSTLTTQGQLEKWQHDNSLSDEQKKWLGTHAMAALIGAKGAAAQANAMAEAIKMFRHPEELYNCIKSYLSTIKQAVEDGIKGQIPIFNKEDARSVAEWIDGLLQMPIDYVKSWFK